MKVVFPDLVIDEYGTDQWAIEWEDRQSNIAIAEYLPETRILQMPRDAPLEVLNHEAHHLLFAYLRDLLNNDVALFPHWHNSVSWEYSMDSSLFWMFPI